MLNSFKLSINDLLKRIYDALLWSLKHSTINQLDEIERTLKQVNFYVKKYC